MTFEEFIERFRGARRREGMSHSSRSSSSPLSPRLGALVLGLVAVTAAARAAEATAASPLRPLLVVVETGPGAGCDAETVRGAIAAELRAVVVAPTATPVVALAGPRADTLLVAIDRDRIVVTLRGRGDQDLTRSVAAPADRAARLRVVAWLAGNVARDQLATLPLPAAPPEGPTAPRAEAPPEGAAATGAVAAPDPVAPAVSNAAVTEPPAFAARPAAPVSVARAEAVSPPSDVPGWNLTAMGGAAAMFASPWESRYATPGGTYSSSAGGWNAAGQLEAHRQRGPWFVGAAVDVGPINIHPLGAAVLVGEQWVPGRLRLEASAGLGAEVYRDRTYYIANTGPGFVAADPGYTAVTKIAGTARVALAASYPLSAELDAVAQLTGHATATSRSDALFVSGAVGLRLRLP
jgi:hypothetical protein